MTTKAQKADQEQARESLRETIKPGDTIFTSVVHVARSGMSRSINVYKLHEGDRDWLSRYVARAGIGTWDDRHEAVKVGGAGMDMGFHIVYELSYALWPDGYGCIGEGCMSNDHSNGDRDYTPHGLFDENSEPENREPYPGEAADGCRAHWHSDGGYALRQRWL